MAEETKPSLNPAQTSLLVQQLRADRVRKQEFVAALTEGTILGVEQVQEIRIANMESGPQNSIGDLVVDAFWGFLFDSSINILISRVVLDRFLGSIERLTSSMHAIEKRRATFLQTKPAEAGGATPPPYSLGRMRSDQQVLSNYFSPQKKKRQSTQSLLESLSPQMQSFLQRYEGKEAVTAEVLRTATGEAQKLWMDPKYATYKTANDQNQLAAFNQYVGRSGHANALSLVAIDARDFRMMLNDDPVAQGGVGVMVEQLLGATRTYLSDSGGASGSVPATDVLAAAYAWASRQRQQIAAIYESAETLLVQAAQFNDVGEMALLLGVTRDTLTIDLGEIRTRSWKLSEAVIWAETYCDSLLGNTGSFGEMRNELSLIGIPTKIADYLVSRFSDDALRWVLSPSADKALAVSEGMSVESRTSAQLRSWAISTLRRAREGAKVKVSEPNFIEKILGDDKAKGSPVAVRCFLLTMLYLYRRSAQDLVKVLEQTKKELSGD